MSIGPAKNRCVYAGTAVAPSSAMKITDLLAALVAADLKRKK